MKKYKTVTSKIAAFIFTGLLALFLPGLALGQVPDSFEPDNSALTAKSIAIGEAQPRSIAPVGDDDWARFTLTEWSSVVVKTGARPGFKGGRTVLTLYGPNDANKQIGFSENFNFTGWSQITANLQPGVYFARVREYGNDATIPGYTLSLDATTICTSDAFEPDNSSVTAKQIQCGIPQERSICGIADDDWAFFTLAEASRVVVKTGARTGFTGGRTVLTLYGPNSATTQIGFSENFNFTGWSQITANLGAGLYFVRVREYGNDALIPGYTLSLQCTTSAGIPDTFEPDNSALTAKTINCGDVQNRSIAPVGDDDWAVFTIPQNIQPNNPNNPTHVVLKTGARPGFLGGRTVLTLYGPNDATKQIGFSENFNFTGWSQITADLGPGVYFARVREFGNDAVIPGYQLSLQCTAKCGDDAFEPDNSSLTAKPISCGELQDRAICPVGDDDWAFFTVADATTVTLKTGARPGFTGGRTVMTLYGPNSATTQIGFSENFNFTGWSQITAKLAAGLYFVRVREYGNDALIPGYRLSLQCSPSPTSADAFEPDNSPLTAKTIPVNFVNVEVQDRSISPVGDDDWAMFTILPNEPNPTHVVLKTGARSGFLGGRTVLTLYGPNDATKQIGFSENFNNTGWSQITADLGPGVYFARVREFGNDAVIPGYQLSLECDRVCGADIFEPDNSSLTAKEILCGDIQNRAICPVGDDDWAFFTVGVGETNTVTIKTGARPGLAGGRTVLTLYGPNSATTQIGFSENFNFTGWSQITAKLTAGLYFVRVRESGNDGLIPGYRLTLQCSGTSAFESDNTAAAAKAIGCGDTQAKAISPAGDVDWVTFTLAQSNRVILSLGDRTGYPHLSADLSLYGPNGSEPLIAMNDDFVGLFPQITADLGRGVYYVRVRGSGNTAVGGYTLSMACSDVPVALVDAFEPDDTAADAKTLDCGVPQDRSIYPVGDVDWATFTLADASHVVITTGDLVDFQGGDTVMTLYASDGTTQLAFNNDIIPGTDLWSQITKDLVAGTYFVKVQDRTGHRVIGGYTLTLVCTPLGCIPDAFEPDNDSASAKPIANGETQDRSICPPGDHDFAVFTLTESSQVVLTTGDRAGFTGGDTVMFLYDSALNQIASNDDYGVALWSQITANLAPGTYYVQVKEFDDTEIIAGYTLNLQSTPLGCDIDAFEPDDDSGTAKPITCGETQDRSICPTGDQDWAVFTLAVASQVVLTTGDRAGFTGGDTEMFLYDSALTLLASNDDFDSVLWSQITMNLAPGTYFVRVHQLGDSQPIPGYTLNLQCTPTK